MNLNTRINRTTAIAVPAVLFVLFTLSFIVLERTSMTIAAYVVGIMASALFCVGNLSFIGTKAGYPWIAAIPMTLWRYIITSTLLSGVFVIGEKFISTFRIPVLVMVMGQIAVFAFYLVMLMLMHTGKEYISDVDQKVAVKRQFIKELSNDLMLVKANAPDEVKGSIQIVIDEVRYSDPMSDDSVLAIEDDIKDSITRLRAHEEPEQIRELCVEIVKKVKERNNLVRSMK